MTNCAEKEDRRERYKSVLGHVQYERQLLYSLFNIFLLADVVFLGFLLNYILGQEKYSGFNMGAGLVALVGLVLSIFWLADYRRRSKYYIFRMAQARDVEVELEGWSLIGGDGRDFAEGKKIQAGKEDHQMSWFEMVFRTKHVLPALICLFIGVYAVIIVGCIIFLL